MGNLTLLDRKPNITNSNKPYKEKYEMFKRDTFFPTRQLLADIYDQNTTWNEVTIQERCGVLVEQAKKKIQVRQIVNLLRGEGKIFT